jgi:hypothetical protein
MKAFIQPGDLSTYPPNFIPTLWAINASRRFLPKAHGTRRERNGHPPACSAAGETCRRERSP